MSGGGEDQLMNRQTHGIGDQGQIPDRDTATSHPVCDAQGTQNGRSNKVW